MFLKPAVVAEVAVEVEDVVDVSVEVIVIVDGSMIVDTW
jgi:hypothetical protein